MRFSHHSNANSGVELTVSSSAWSQLIEHFSGVYTCNGNRPLLVHWTSYNHSIEGLSLARNSITSDMQVSVIVEAGGDGEVNGSYQSCLELVDILCSEISSIGAMVKPLNWI